MKAIERPLSWFNADYDEPKYPRCRCCNKEVDRYYYDFGDELIYCQSCVDKLMFSMRAEDDEQEYLKDLIIEEMFNSERCVCLD